MRILIIDDNSVDREETKRALLDASVECQFCEAESVKEGLNLLSNQPFDVVLLDYLMPEQDGIEFLHELNAHPLEAATAIIMVSAVENEMLALECIRAGAQDFLVKSKITEHLLWRSIIHAQARFELKLQLRESYLSAKRLSERDALTGLMNRRSFEKTRQIAVTNLPRGTGMMAILLIDIDNFKSVNDNYGHGVGDELLKQIARRIQGVMRGHELLARIGGDEFAIILTNISKFKIAGDIAKRILNLFKTPFIVNKNTIDSACSIGIALHPTAEHSPEDLIKFADLAMYRAKCLGKNQLCFFEEGMQKDFQKRIRLEQELKVAIEKSEFFLEYQPIFDTSQNDIIGVEALIRWHKNNEIRYPERFIAAAESSKLMDEIGLWVIDEAISQFAKWQSLGNVDLFLSINLSVIQLIESDLVAALLEILRKHGINPDRLVFEITEKALMLEQFKEKPSETITQLSQLGCNIALDDFGTGYSSLYYLQNFPIDCVKIDKSLILACEEPEAKKVLNAIANMVQSLGLDLIAEGIETQESLAMCRSIGMHKVQGFYLSKPVSAEKITMLLS
ncbi:putative bifunctional diguanylate cyclase/phosphodiesterase [Thalassotalea fusca]